MISSPIGHTTHQINLPLTLMIGKKMCELLFLQTDVFLGLQPPRQLIALLELMGWKKCSGISPTGLCQIIVQPASARSPCRMSHRIHQSRDFWDLSLLLWCLMSLLDTAQPALMRFVITILSTGLCLPGNVGILFTCGVFDKPCACLISGYYIYISCSQVHPGIFHILV